MKREIQCAKCIAETEARYPNRPATRYKGEYVKVVRGKAQRQYVCDCCAALIQVDEPCGCFSIYTDERPYFDWEGGCVS